MLLRVGDVLLGFGSLIVAGLFLAYGEVLGLRVHAERYRRMRELYDQVHLYFASPDWGGRSPGQPGTDQQQLFDLGREALGENARWLREQRKRDEEGPPT